MSKAKKAERERAQAQRRLMIALDRFAPIRHRSKTSLDYSIALLDFLEAAQGFATKCDEEWAAELVEAKEHIRNVLLMSNVEYVDAARAYLMENR